MLDVTDHVLRLFALHQIAHHGSGQQRVFSGVLESPPVPGFARKVHASTQRHIEALRTQFAADKRAVFAGALRVPARSCCHGRRKRCRVTSIGSTVANAVGGVGNQYRRNAQAFYAFDVACAAIPQMGQGHLPLGGMLHAVAMQERNLLL